ncbi:NUDIX domain-containing protein [Deinococcus knuensis]|uniref:Nudix hydrolase domain-containing protein n=1 Tax=Deinococcus knuensis TaxID=1837380 RepID=A0ABQ2SK98_9DEIO|nr:NUDIX hydrolase [Deinococcus knuensis]GGS32036.1 hypothetical protein GCM10008961_24710 [Deinococcus knuensis]
MLALPRLLTRPRRRKDFYVNARAVIERSGPHGREVLLQRRVKPGQPRRLEFPGGQLDPFEGITDALAREVREETGLTVTDYLTDLRGTTTGTPAAEVECLIRIPSVSLTTRNHTGLPTPRPEFVLLPLASARTERFAETVQPEPV